MSAFARRVFILLGCLYAVRLVLIGMIQLAPDEAYYWSWAKHPDLSYFDHPPMVAYIMAIFTKLGGDTPFFVRIGGLLCTIPVHLFVFLSARRIAAQDADLAWLVLLMLNCTLLLPTGCLVQTPDTPLLLFWSMALFCGSAIATGGRACWWYPYGIALGMGLLSKYSMILIVFCQLGFMFFSPDMRHWLKRKDPYLALGLGLLIFSPVLLWNWENHWISFGYQLSHGLRAKSDSIFFKLAEYTGGQFGVITPLLFFAFAFYCVRGLFFYIRDQDIRLRYLAWLSWPVVIFFGLTTVIGDAAEPNWTAPAYLAGLLLTGAIFKKHYWHYKGHRWFMGAALGLGLVLNIVIHIHLVRPIIPIAPKKDTLRQFYGWRELGADINALIAKYPSHRGYFLISNKATTAAEAVFYTNNVYTGFDLFKLEKYSYLNEMDQLEGKDALILIYFFNQEKVRRYEPFFDDFSVIGKHNYTYRGTVIKKMSVVIALGKKFRGSEGKHVFLGSSSSPLETNPWE